MTLQSISTFIRQSPAHGVWAYNQIKTKSVDAYHRMSGRINETWTNKVKPLITHRIHLIPSNPAGRIAGIFNRTYQRVSAFIKQTPQYAVRAFNHIKAKSIAPFNRVSALLIHIWTEGIKALHAQRIHALYIAPLNISHLIIIGSSLAITASVMVLGIAILGKAFIAASVVGGMASIMIGWTISRHLINSRFKKEAGEIINQMVVIVEGATQNDPRLNEFAQQRILLDEPKFEHLKSSIQELDKHTSEFRRDTLNLNARVGFDPIKNTYLTYLRKLGQTLAR